MKRLRESGKSFLISLSMLVIALFVGGLFILAVGKNPIQAYALLIRGAFGSGRAIANSIANSVPLMFTGMAFAIANKAGCFNLGGEGQLYFGGLCGTLFAIFVPVQSRALMLAGVFAVSILGGMLMGGIVGALKAKFGTNEVIVAIMLNYLVELFCTFLVTGPIQDPSSTVNQTVMITDLARLTKIVKRTQLTTAVFIALATAVFVWFLLRKTKLGFKMRSVGDNKEAARACGINCNRYIVLAMAISGGVAALAGITEITGKYFRFRENFSTGFGFTGVAIAALGNNNPFGIILSSLLFGAMDVGSLTMGREMGLTGEMTTIIQSIVILLVATPRIVEYFEKWKKERKK